VVNVHAWRYVAEIGPLTRYTLRCNSLHAERLDLLYSFNNYPKALREQALIGGLRSEIKDRRERGRGRLPISLTLEGVSSTVTSV